MRKGETWADREVKIQWLNALATEQGDGCRDWPWSLSNKGYGQIRWDGRNRRAGHVILELTGRPRPSVDHHQLHACDRPSCVAPWHLRWGTNAENRRESIERGRHATKLTEAEVLAIYATEGERQRDTAARFGVTQRVVWGIKNGKTWRHVTGAGEAA